MKKKTKVNISNVVFYIILTCFIGLMIQSQILINEIRTQIKNDVIINANRQESTNN